MTPLSWVLLALPVYLLVKGRLIPYLALAVPETESK
jgi:hypothetical protein